MTDFVTLDGIVYAVRDPQVVSYAMHESPEQRKARRDAKPPTYSYTVTTIERIFTAPPSSQEPLVSDAGRNGAA